MHVNVNNSSLSSLVAAIVAVLVFLAFLCLGPCPSLPPPLDQLCFPWPIPLQFLHFSSDLVFLSDFPRFLGLFHPPFFAWAARASSAFFPCSLLIIQCWASSMRKAIRSLCFIFVDCAPVSMLALSVAVIVCRVGQYDLGNDNMIRVLKWVSARLDLQLDYQLDLIPFLMRFLQCCSMV